MRTERLLKDIAEWLESESIGLNHGAQVFSGRLPDTEAAAVGLLEYGALGPVFTMDTDDAQPVAQVALVQCMCRNSDYDACAATAHAAHESILKLSGQVWQSIRFVNVNPIQSRPFYAGDDEDGDVLFSCNYAMEIEPS